MAFLFVLFVASPGTLYKEEFDNHNNQSLREYDVKEHPSSWREQGDTFDFEGHRIFYRDSGDHSKPDLLLLHGFPTSSWDWHEIWPELTQMFRVVCFDFIGFGYSDKPADLTYSILMQADIAEALLNRLHIDAYHLMSHDYGDTVAQELLARNNARAPSMIQSTVLLNGGLFPETHRPAFIQRLLISPIGGWVAKMANAKKFKRTMNQICTRQLSDEALSLHWELMEREGGRLIMHKLIRYMEERRRYRPRWASALQNAATPVRLIDGLDDPISGEHMKIRYEELITDPDTVGLAGVGHYPQNEAPEAVLSAAKAFWEKQGVTQQA